MGEPRKREWSVPWDLQINGPQLPLDEQDMVQKLADLWPVLRDIGGVAMVAAARQEIAPNVYVTTGLRVRHESYAPAARQEQPQDEEPTEVLEPELAG